MLNRETRSDIERFLAALSQAVQGQTDTPCSMYAVGEKIGMARETAGRIAEEAIAQGWAEIRTLAGEIGITPAGLDHLKQSLPENVQAAPSLGRQPILDDPGIADLGVLAAELKGGLVQAHLDFDILAEAAADLRSLDVQLASPRVKTAIVRAVLEDLVHILTGRLPDTIIQRVRQYLA